MPGGGVPRVPGLRGHHGRHLPPARGGRGVRVRVGRLRHWPRDTLPPVREARAAVGLRVTRDARDVMTYPVFGNIRNMFVLLTIKTEMRIILI